MSPVDVAVIGRGMIGSAAARHLAEGGVSTALIGPTDAIDPTTIDGPFSSHGDEGRITRIAGRSLEWAQLAARSIARYRDIEQRSGISFHTGRGLAISLPALDDWLDSGLIHGSNIRSLPADDLAARTGITVPGQHPVAYEGPPAGHINPRRLVAAQTRLTELAGGTVIDDTVTGLVAAPASGSGRYQLTGAFGSVEASRILVATGAFGGHLLDAELDIEHRPRTIVMAELIERATDADPDAEPATSSPMPAGANLPSLILADPPDQRLAELYWVPPVPYPDGGTYLKIGGNLRTNPRLPGEDDLVEWFHSSGDRAESEALEASLRALLPALDLGAVTTRPCVIAGTPSGYPYIGWVDDGIAVAIGGNGSSAKSSDELGRLAASLFAPDGWSDPLDASLFAPQFR